MKPQSTSPLPAGRLHRGVIVAAGMMALALALGLCLAVGLWQLATGSLIVFGAPILWAIATSVVVAQLIVLLIALAPGVSRWVARRKTMADRMTVWLAAQALLALACGVLWFHTSGSAPVVESAVRPSFNLLANETRAADLVRWQSLIAEESAKTWLFTARPFLGLVRDAREAQALDKSVNAWSMVWGQQVVLGATPALLSLPDSLVRAVIAHELGHVAMGSSETLETSTRALPYSLLFDVLCMTLLAVALALCPRLTTKTIATLVIANMIAWLTVSDVAGWAQADRQDELTADRFAAAWASPVEMARALVLANGACTSPSLPPASGLFLSGPLLTRWGASSRFDDHPSLDVRLDALGADLPAICQGLLDPQP